LEARSRYCSVASSKRALPIRRFNPLHLVISADDKVDRLEACTASLPPEAAERVAQQAAVVAAEPAPQEAAELGAQREAVAAAEPGAQQEEAAAGDSVAKVLLRHATQILRAIGATIE
jgi:hypothetical protein